MIKFPKLVQEAHGCEQPRAIRTYVKTETGWIHYRLYLPDFSVTLNVPLPIKTVAYHLAQQEPAFRPDLPWEHAEHFFSHYQVRVVDAVAYALAGYHAQPADVRQYLINRFGPQLDEARQLAEVWWTRIPIE